MNPQDLAFTFPTTIQKKLNHLQRAFRPFLVAACVATMPATSFAERSYQSWLKRYESDAVTSQQGRSVAFDARGNVAVTGINFDEQGDEHFYTAKYSGNDGSLLWEVPFDGNGNSNIPNAVVCDSNGNVIVTGGAAVGAGTDLDLYTVKYAAADGAIVWEGVFDANSGGDEGLLITVDGIDNVVVAGRSVDSGTQENVYLVKYSAAGNAGVAFVLWDTVFNFTNRRDVPRALTIDSTGAVVVSGITNDAAGTKYYTGRYNGTTGAPIWEKVFPLAGVSGDAEAHGVAVDADGNVFTTGRSRNGADYDILTIKYAVANGAVLWDEAFNSPGDNFQAPAGVVVDSRGNAIVASTSVDDDNFAAQRFHVTQYQGSDGQLLWETFSSPPNDEDIARKIAIDAADNVIVTGTSFLPQPRSDQDYYTVSYSGLNGRVQWEQRFRGSRPSGGTDLPQGLAVDALGNVAVTGLSGRLHPNGSTGLDEIVTIKYQRLALVTGDPVPGAGVEGSGIKQGSKFSALGVPALADDGTLAAKVSFKAGKTLGGGIIRSGVGGNIMAALKKGPAPTITGAKYKSFLDPVIAPNGTVAFYASLTGVPDPQAGAVFTDSFTGTFQSALQIGTSIPIAGFDPGVLVKSVSTIALRNNFLVALVKIKGTGVTKGENDTLLLSRTSGGTFKLLRTGDLLMAGDDTTNITKISVLQPAPGSGGQGRWQSTGRITARVTVGDDENERHFVVFVTAGGVVTQFLATGGNADVVNTGAQWKSFGLPSIASNGFNFAVSGKLALELGDVTEKDDTALVHTLTGTTFTEIAREGDTADDAGNAKYKSFKDPVSNNQGAIAFLATLSGQGVTASNNSGLWWGDETDPNLVMRTGRKAPNAAAIESKAKFTALTSFALPNGSDAAPLFIGKVVGPGVTSKNNTGLWGVGSDLLIRQLLRTGDKFGKLKVKGFQILGSGRGAFSTGRSYNSTGGVVALVTFTNGQRAIVPIANP